MSNLAIRVDGIGKQYRIGLKEERSETLAGAAAKLITSPVKRLQQLRSLSSFREDEADDIVWALRDVSFTVSHGEAVGLIGRNGAGKSTLLKVLSRITEPSRGRIELYGRVASLLEVGTGFNAELTGRENAYLNGAILGMKKAEVDRKFDEIVAFSGVEKYIDTPVKRYSSGMRVRLAFAVAAHLEPEILLIDEVLAVGDVAFQKKCLGKMDDVASEGRTVIFVSHHMSMIQALCTRGIVMSKGRIIYDGQVNDAVASYLSDLEDTAADPFGDNPERSGNGRVRFTDVRIRDKDGQSVTSVVAGEPLTIEFDYDNAGATEAAVKFTVYNGLGAAVFHLNFDLTQFRSGPLGRTGSFTCRVPSLPLPPARYRIAAGLDADGASADHIPAALYFDVASSVFFNTGRTPDTKYSMVMVDHEWGHAATAQRSVSVTTS